ncbi:MAG: DUF1573 domain-containing protein [Cyclobacteriaceae bacterium]
MRRIIITALGLLIALAAYSQVNAPQKKDGPAIAFEQATFDFGDLTQGDRVEHTFKFTNTGSKPLIITNVEVTCGCTTPKGWPRDPIQPGGKGELLIAFNSAGKYGRQNKVVTVVSNSVEGNSQVTFTANVLEKKAPNQ